ncbi:MAG: enoyl-CoA hydratase/carnithine racemase [Planctomycetota bacterium]|jgi:enoyl-CoA hydratase/carnithine racemase
MTNPIRAMLLRKIPQKGAKDLILNGRRFEDKRALKLGGARVVVPSMRSDSIARRGPRSSERDKAVRGVEGLRPR